MTKTEKLIFIADYIEPWRNNPRSWWYSRYGIITEGQTIYEISNHSTIFNIKKDITYIIKTIDSFLNYYNYRDERINNIKWINSTIFSNCCDVNRQIKKGRWFLRNKKASKRHDRLFVTHGNNVNDKFMIA